MPKLGTILGPVRVWAGCCVIAGASVLIPRPVEANPIAIGQFSFDILVDPAVQVSNDSEIAFKLFSISLESDLVGSQATVLDVRPLVTNESLAANDARQWVPDLFSDVPGDSFLIPRRARLSLFTYGATGKISFSFDDGKTFLDNAVLDFSSNDSILGIFFDAEPTAASPVPEPATVGLLIAGLAALRGRRLLRRNSR